MNITLDIIGSSIIAGIVFLILFNLNTASSSEKFSSDVSLRLQQNAETLASILDYDLRKIGYGYNGTAITRAEPKLITYYTDLDTNGVLHQITLTIGDSTEVTSTPNPHDKILYRIVDGDTSKGPALNLTDLRFTYLNTLGKVTSVLDSIKYIKAEIWLQSPEKVDTMYIPSFWEITIHPRNI